MKFDVMSMVPLSITYRVSRFAYDSKSMYPNYDMSLVKRINDSSRAYLRRVITLGTLRWQTLFD